MVSGAGITVMVSVRIRVRSGGRASSFLACTTRSA